MRAALLILLVSAAAATPARAAEDACAPTPWTAAWGTAMAGTSFTPAVEQTLRMVVRPTGSGTQLRLRFSNRFGSGRVRLDGVYVGRRAQGPAVVPGSTRPVLFAGRPDAIVPAGGTLVSDAAAFAVEAGADLAVSFHVLGAGSLDTHPFARQTSYLTPAFSGGHGAEEDGAAFTQTTAAFTGLDGIDVLAPSPRPVVVALGDSITDGEGTTKDANLRWPDQFARRLTGGAVINAGIGGNAASPSDGRAGTVSFLVGPQGTKRFDHDVLDRTGVSDVVIFEGTNDLGNGVPADDLIDAYKVLIARAHARGINVIGATILPTTERTHDGPGYRAARAQVNAWIRTSGAFDAVADFDAALRDPADPNRLRPDYDSGDELHPGDAGARALAEALDLRAVRGPVCGTAPEPRLRVRARRRGRRARVTGTVGGLASCAGRGLVLRVTAGRRTVRRRRLTLRDCAFRTVLPVPRRGRLMLRARLVGTGALATIRIR